jgi:hypothetical protein
MQRARRPKLILPSTGIATGPVPGTPAWNAQFGRGFTVLICAGLASFGIPLVLAISSGSPMVRAKGIAAAIAGFGSCFAGGFIYTVARGIGIPVNMVVLHPRSTPIRYFLLATAVIALSLAMAIFAVWCYFHTNAVAEFIASHPPGGD